MSEFGFDWIVEQVDALGNPNSVLDKESLQAFLIMEMADQKAALKSRIRILLMHLLKWKYQPDYQTRSWRHTIREQRRRISDILEESTNLDKQMFSMALGVYPKARVDASEETNLPIKNFPESLEFSKEEIINVDFYPS